MLTWLLSLFRRPTPPTAAPTALDLLRAVNATRKVNGLRPLVQMANMAGAAQAWATIVSTGDVRHDGGPYEQCVSLGYDSAACCVAAWCGHPPHRAIILDPKAATCGCGVETVPLLGTAYVLNVL